MSRYANATVPYVTYWEHAPGQTMPEERALLTKLTGWGASEIASGVFPQQILPLQGSNLE
jgi:hypothetical protein